MGKFLYRLVSVFLLFATVAQANDSFELANLSRIDAPRFMSLDAVRAGIPSGSALRPMRHDRVTNDPITPTLVGNGLAKPGFMPIKRDAIIPTPSRGIPMMRVPIQQPMAAEAMPMRPSPKTSAPPTLSKSHASPLLDLFGGRNAAVSNNFYDALRSEGVAR